MAFITPPPRGTVGDYSNLSSYAIDSTIQVKWEGTPTPLADLWLLKDGDQYTCEELELVKVHCELLLSAFTPTETSYSWTVQTYGLIYNTTSPIYYLGLTTHDNSGRNFTSHYFNIEPAGQVPTSVVTSTMSSTTSTFTTMSSGSTSSTTFVASSTSSTSASPSPSHSSSPASGLSPGTTAALGASVGIGIPILILLALIAWFLRRKRGNNNRINHPPTIPDGLHPAPAGDPHARYSDKGASHGTAMTTTQELYGNQQYTYYDRKSLPSELSGSGR